LALVGLLLSIDGSGRLCAQESAQKVETAQQAGAPSLLVLQNGRVVDGRISQCSAGYMVELQNGNMVVPKDLVQFEAADLSEAHAKLKQRVFEKTPETQLNLARWCLANHMLGEAKDEVRAAIELQPDNNEAITMLERIEVLQRQNALPTGEVQSKPEQTPDGFKPSGPVSLAGLTPETVREFSSRIQPILLNKCGNASCHGSVSSNKFPLAHPRGGNGNRRRVIEDNFASVLGQIDIDKPKESPLLVVPEGRHGRNGRVIFAGAHDEALHETLKAWVTQVVAEKTGKSDPSMTEHSRRGSKNLQSKSNGANVKRTVFVDVPQKPFSNAPPKSIAAALAPHQPKQVPAQNESRSRDGNSKKAKEAVVSHDPFDPAAFNRAKFGSAYKK
jgi:hypothetical protein